MTPFKWLLSTSIIGLAFVLACGGGAEAPAAAPTAAAPAAESTAAAPTTAATAAPTALAPTLSAPTKALVPTAAPGAGPVVVPPLAKRDDAQYGGTLRLGYFRKAANMDGIRSSGSFDRIYLKMSNEHMITLGRQAVYEPQESLAYAFEILDEGMRIRFHIREGVQFHRGQGELKASDVAFSLNRVRDPDSGEGGTKFWAGVKDAVAVDDYTIDLFMKEFDGLIIAKHLFTYNDYIHSEKYWNEVGPDAHVSLPAPTGPFVGDKWTPGVGIDLSKHQDYWKEGRPYADAVEMRVITETRTRLAALETGQLNVAWLQAEMVPMAKEDPDIQVWANPGVGWDGWYWSNGLPPYDDFRIRQAQIKAVDRKAVNNSIYLNTMMNHNAYAHSPDTSPFGVDLTDVWEGAMKYDPPAAKALVEEYAAEKGLSLPLTIKGVCERRPDRQQYCEFLQAAWADIGLKFEFNIVPAAADRARVMYECQTHVTQTGATMNPLGTTLDAQLTSWANNNYATNPCKDKGQALGPENQAIQDSIDAQFKKASATTDPAIQAEAYKAAQRLALENAWIYNPSMHRVNYVGCYTPNTGGCDVNPFWAHGFWHTQDFWVKK